MLKVAGFEDIRMNASYDVYDSAIAARYLARFTGDHPIAPDLFLAQPWCEALGISPRKSDQTENRKPGTEPLVFCFLSTFFLSACSSRLAHERNGSGAGGVA
jgi:hypothetical protein